MITSVKIQNFKSLKNVETDLERLTVFVGANGSGKTSVLSALHRAVHAMTAKDPNRVFRGERHCDWLYSRGGVGDMRVACETSWRQSFEVTARSLSGNLSAKPDLLGKGIWDIQTYSSNSGNISMFSLGHLTSLKLDASKLAQPSYPFRGYQRVEADGTGLASTLAVVALQMPETFAKIERYMCQLISGLTRIHFRKQKVKRKQTEVIQVNGQSYERVKTRVYVGDALLFDFEHAKNVAAHAVSEGTILMLGMLAVLFTGDALVDTEEKNEPQRLLWSILLLDDIERGLHPSAQKQLIVVLRQLLEAFSDLQIIATAHSPYLLDELRPEEIRLMATGADGYSVCGKLTNHPLFEQWKDEMAPGELWSMFGEKWLVDQGAAK